MFSVSGFLLVSSSVCIVKNNHRVPGDVPGWLMVVAYQAPKRVLATVCFSPVEKGRAPTSKVLEPSEGHTTPGWPISPKP